MMRKGWRSERIVVRTLMTGVVGISLLTFAGHAFRVEFLASWGLNPPMALHTALCFLLTAACFFMLTRTVD